MVILQCERLMKVYGSGSNQVTALDQVSLSVMKGEFVSVVGASGSGKSTLLHILGAVDVPTGGTVTVDNTDLTALTPTEASIYRRSKVGLIYQFYNLIPVLSVRKNIMLPMMLDKRQPNMDDFEQLTERLGLTKRLDCLPHQLSGGEQQRTAIARALLYRPAVILADEPTGNLDQHNSREVVELLQFANQEMGQTILLITHDTHVALSANRMIRLEDGRVIADEPVVHRR